MAKRIVGLAPSITILSAPDGVKVELRTWSDNYTGSKDALIAAGYRVGKAFRDDRPLHAFLTEVER